VRTKGVIHQQFTTVIFVGFRKEQGSRQVRPDTATLRSEAEGVVDMVTEMLAALIAIKEWGKR
jgi:hypothetical protein